ncbi:MAG TPA: hypothetical protein VFI96_05210 [Longimicrobiaceae bacterium]|nr:hypothetical protein [Longimicrobiaceae bacterium]
MAPATRFRIAGVYNRSGSSWCSGRIRLDSKGRLISTRAYHYSPVRVPDSYLNDFLPVRRSGLERLGVSLREAARIIEPRMWRHFPAISKVMAGVDGSVWLKVQPVTAGMVWWWVLDENGDPVGRFRLTSDLRLYYADSRVVWGVEPDDLGVNYLVRYRIQRPE